MGEPHTHYNRSVSEPTLLHERNGEKVGGCKDMRWRIKAGIEAHLTEDWLQRNVSGSDGDYLHHHESCSCEMGKIKQAANKKIADFNKAVIAEIQKIKVNGNRVERRKQKRVAVKKVVMGILQEILQVNGNKVAEMEKQNIMQIVRGL